jgi:hypothetical protein
VVTLTPEGPVVSQVAFTGVEVDDPDGEALVFEVTGHPEFAASWSVFLGSLSHIYVPGFDEDEICRAIRERDDLVDEFEVVVRDPCGAEVEIPGTVTIRVVDRDPPVITVPAQDLVVECDGRGNWGAYFAWLGTHGGAQAEDPCTPRLSWSSIPDPFIAGCGRTGYRDVVFVVRDAAGNAARTRARFEIRDTTRPELTVAGVALGCNPSDTSPDATGWATASDNCDPSPQVTYTDSVATVGCTVTIERTWMATDACGNTAAPKTQRITYTQDTAPPVLTVPGDVVVECHQVPTVGVATATDNCVLAPQVEYLGEERIDGPCPYTYTLIRTWRATDGCGNSAQRSQTITVRDTTRPVLTVPANVDLGCNPLDTSPDATRWATATDNCDPAPLVTYTDSVSTVGCRVTIERTWRATDACRNSAQGVQRITYTQDTEPPTIHCPGHVYRTSTEPPGSRVWVTFPITASDACDPSPAVSCSPAGGYFEVGTTTLAQTSCTARDACGNEVISTCTFWVTVEFVCPPLFARSDSADAPGHVWIPVLANLTSPSHRRLKC